MRSAFFSMLCRAYSLIVTVALTSLTQVPAMAASAPPLVSVEWLLAHRDQPGLVILDIRSAVDGGGAEAFAKAHIPGAIHSDYEKGGWRVTRDGVPFMLPTAAALEKLIGGLGIDENSHVVVVPAGVHATDFGAAARVYWTLKVAGVQNVSILDGGFAAWRANPANPVESGASRSAPKIFTARIDQRLMAEASDVEKVSQQGGAVLIDARPPSFFLGREKAPAARAYGHIPGAINLNHASFYDAKTNRLKPVSELAAIAAALPSGPAVAYCNTGHWAAINWFVLAEILGRQDTRLYDGSMVDWTSNPARPVVSARTKWDDLKKALGFGS